MGLLSRIGTGHDKIEVNMDGEAWLCLPKPRNIKNGSKLYSIPPFIEHNTDFDRSAKFPTIWGIPHIEYCSWSCIEWSVSFLLPRVSY